MRLPKSFLDVWISQESLNALHVASADWFPLEAGGLLIGYWCSPNECVIQHATTPGAGAKHSRYGYVPDYEHDERQTARFHARSDGVSMYLGDWHSHPNTRSPYLSPQDRRALRNIALSEDARVPRPLSLVCAGTPGEWRQSIWMGEIAHYWFGMSFLAAIRARVLPYRGQSWLE